MPYHQRLLSSQADLSAILALKELCTTARTCYDRPTTSDLRQLLGLPRAPVSGINVREEAWRSMTRRLTALWEDASGQAAACALIQPGCNLAFYIHP
ncbi:MAG TPA: hypothetical protein VGF67_32795 [Ktedonobacteraceae bacterium]